MTERTLLLAAMFLFLTGALFLSTRGRRELIESSGFSRGAFLAMVLCYLSILSGALFASWSSTWPLPLNRPLAQIIGASVFILGIGIHLAARLQLRSLRATWGLQIPQLITTGIYTVVRHPQSLGWSLLLIGVAVFGRSGAALGFAGLFIAHSLLWLPAEEAALERRFGAEYTAYKTRTHALIPFGPRR